MKKYVVFAAVVGVYSCLLMTSCTQNESSPADPLAIEKKADVQMSQEFVQKFTTSAARLSDTVSMFIYYTPNKKTNDVTFFIGNNDQISLERFTFGFGSRLTGKSTKAQTAGEVCRTTDASIASRVAHDVLVANGCVSVCYKRGWYIISTP
jgi:hypothetical protein